MNDNWRTTVPEPLRNLPDMISTIEICKIFGYSPASVRRLRSQRLRLDREGKTDPDLTALPAPLGVCSYPVLWSAEDVIVWGLQTGRLDPETGKARRLWSPGRPKKNPSYD